MRATHAPIAKRGGQAWPRLPRKRCLPIVAGARVFKGDGGDSLPPQAAGSTGQQGAGAMTQAAQVRPRPARCPSHGAQVPCAAGQNLHGVGIERAAVVSAGSLLQLRRSL